MKAPQEKTILDQLLFSEDTKEYANLMSEDGWTIGCKSYPGDGTETVYATRLSPEFKETCNRTFEALIDWDECTKSFKSTILLRKTFLDPRNDY